MTIIKKSKNKAKIYCDICNNKETVGLDNKDNEFWELPDDWQYILMEDKPNTIHICPKHKIEFSHSINVKIQTSIPLALRLPLQCALQRFLKTLHSFQYRNTGVDAEQPRRRWYHCH